MALLNDPGLGGANKFAFQNWMKTRYSGLPGSGGGSLPGAGVEPGTHPNTASQGVDYASLIQNDPAFKQSRADLSAQGIHDASSRAAAIAKGLVQFGIVPDLATAAQTLGLSQDQADFLNSDVTDATRSLAEKNTNEGLSITARLRDAYAQNQRAIKNQLAARGMLQSGETSYLLGRAGQDYKQAQSDALSQLSDYIGSVYGSYADKQSQIQRQLADLASQAADRQAGLLGSGGSTGDTGGTTGPQVTGLTGLPVGATNDPSLYLKLGRKMDPRFTGLLG